MKIPEMRQRQLAARLAGDRDLDVMFDKLIECIEYADLEAMSDLKGYIDSSVPRGTYEDMEYDYTCSQQEVDDLEDDLKSALGRIKELEAMVEEAA